MIVESPTEKRLFIFGTSKPALPVLGGKVFGVPKLKHQFSEKETLDALHNHATSLQKQSQGKESIFFVVGKCQTQFGKFISPLVDQLQAKLVPKERSEEDVDSLPTSCYAHHFGEYFEDLVTQKQGFGPNYLAAVLTEQIVSSGYSWIGLDEVVSSKIGKRMNSRIHFINLDLPMQEATIPKAVLGTILKIALHKDRIILPDNLVESLAKMEQQINHKSDETREGILMNVRTSTDVENIVLPEEPQEPTLKKHVSRPFMEVLAKKKFKYLLSKIRKLKLFIMTWNVAGNLPEDKNLPDLKSVFPAKELPDVLVFGFQEILEAKFGNVAKNMFSSNAEEIGKKWVEVITQRLEKTYPGNYTFMTSEASLTMLMVVFAHARVDQDMSHNSTSQVKDGIRGFVGTKRSFICNLEYKGNKIKFCTTHLSAGDDPKPRQQMIAELQTMLCSAEQTQLSFLLGDLNMRVKMDKKAYADLIKDRKADNPEISWETILQHDEIKRGDQPGLQMTEGQINFPATFKFDLSQETPTYQEDRQASWCDRILYWKSPKDQINVECSEYNSIETNLSDHRYASF